MKTEKRWIVLAKVTQTGLRDSGRLHRPDGVNWAPVFIPEPEAKAAVWCRGDDEDEAKGRAFAKEEGYHVFVFPLKERDPLGKSKALAMLDYYEKVQEHMQT